MQFPTDHEAAHCVIFSSLPLLCPSRAQIAPPPPHYLNQISFSPGLLAFPVRGCPFADVRYVLVSILVMRPRDRIVIMNDLAAL